MLRDSLFTLLAQRLGARADLIPRMATEVQLLQEVRLEQNPWLPWFLETEISEAVTEVGEERLALPADFLEEIEEQALWLHDVDADVVWAPLGKMSYDQMLARYPGSGRPRAYSLGAEYFMLRPVPDEVFTLKMRYMAKDAILDSDIENKWLKHASDVVMAELGATMAQKHMQHAALATAFKEDATTAWNRLYSKHIARQEANLNRVMEA